MENDLSGLNRAKKHFISKTDRFVKEKIVVSHKTSPHSAIIDRVPPSWIAATGRNGSLPNFTQIIFFLEKLKKNFVESAFFFDSVG